MTEKEYPLYVLITDMSGHPLGVLKGYTPPYGRSIAIAFHDKESVNYMANQGSCVDYRQALFHKIGMTTEHKYEGFSLQTDASYSDLLTLDFFIGFMR